MDLDAEKVRRILIGLFVLLVSVALHEFGHAIMADMLGDDTPRRQGRVTLNPLAHADPIGTFLLPLAGGLWGAAGAGGARRVGEAVASAGASRCSGSRSGSSASGRCPPRRSSSRSRDRA